jgi:DNA-binding NarL/FixJ family response regulator
LESVKIAISSITDDILVGTDNLKLISEIRAISPHAKIVVTAQSNTRARELYAAGADYVLRPNKAAASQLLPAVESLLQGEEEALKKGEIDKLDRRQEILN